MRKGTKILVVIALVGLGISYIVQKVNEKMMVNILEKYVDEELLKKLNSDEIQEKLAELEKEEWAKKENMMYYRIAAIQCLRVRDNDADKMIQIVEDLGLSTDEGNEWEVIADHITKIHKELGL